MSRRVWFAGLILVVLVWAGVLLSPPLRLLLRAQIDTLRSPEALQRRDDKELARVFQAHPDDPRVLAVGIQSQLYRNEGEQFTFRAKKALRRYDELIQKFPREIWLMQDRLRLSASGDFGVKSGEFDTSQSSSASTPWMSRAEMLQTLKIAERGARLEPQNSFYDWMRALLLFGLKRDEEALRVLEIGSHKSRFDDGSQHKLQNDVFVRALQSPTLWEERIVTIIPALAYPRLFPIRTVNMAANWRGVLHERCGEHQRALEIYGAQMRLARIMRHDAKRIVALRVAESLEQSVWGGLTRRREATAKFRSDPRQRGGAWESSRQGKVDLASRFAAYARRHGRDDLAAETMQDVRQFSVSDRGNWPADAFFGGLTNAEALPILQLQWTNALLLRAIIAGSLCWLLLSALSWKIGLPRIKSLDVVAATLFVAIVITIFFVAALNSSQSAWEYLIRLQWPLQSEINNNEGFPFLSIVRLCIGWLPILLTVVYCAIGVRWRARKQLRRSKVAPQEQQSIPTQIKNGLGWGEKLLLLLPFAALCVWWGQVFIDLLNAPGTLWLSIVGFLPVLLCSLLFWLYLKLRFRLPLRLDWPYFVGWCRGALGLLICVGSVSYLLIALWSLPMRHRANERFDDYLQRGEVAMMRDASKR